MSESWIENNMYCPCCGHQSLEHLPNNSPAADFQCNCCDEIFELKSKKGRRPKIIPAGAYTKMVERIGSNTNPNLLFLQYSNNVVTDLNFIPKFFFVPGLIEERNPLAPTARRAGWVGCNILYAKIPEQGKIKIVERQQMMDMNSVLRQYERIKSLQINRIENRGWLMDVLKCVNKIPGNEFQLSDVYNFSGELQSSHINNDHIQAKIRQQLQILRNKGYLEFLGKGHYRKS